MTEPTDAPKPAESPTWTLRRTLRTPSAETWDVVAGNERVGIVSLQYGTDAVEGMLSLPAADKERAKELLGYVTDLLALDLSAGAGGVIHLGLSAGRARRLLPPFPGPPAARPQNH